MVCTCVCAQVYACMYVYVYVCICVRMYACVHVRRHNEEGCSPHQFTEEVPFPKAGYESNE